MAEFVEFPLEGGEEGEVVRVQIDAPEGTGMTEASAAGDLVAKAKKTFQAVVGELKKSASLVVAELKDLASQPDEIGLEFSFGFDVEGNAFFAKAGANATFKVSMKWNKKTQK
jgi:hypothetical protein